MSLPTAADIRTVTLKSITGTDLDADITKVIAAADEMCARYCLFPQSGSAMPSLDKDAAGSTHVLYLDGPSRRDPRILNLDLRPIVSVTSVYQDENGDWTYTQHPTEGTDFVVTPTGQLISYPNTQYPWLQGLRKIKVTCVSGFDVSTHYPTREAIAILTAYLWNHGYRSSEIQTMTAGAQSMTIGQPVGLPVVVKQILEPYRLVEREGRR